MGCFGHGFHYCKILHILCQKIIWNVKVETLCVTRMQKIDKRVIHTITMLD